MTNFRIVTLSPSDSDAILSWWRHYDNRIASLSEEKKKQYFFSLQKYSKWDTKPFFRFFLKKSFLKTLADLQKTTTFAPAIERDANWQIEILVR